MHAKNCVIRRSITPNLTRHPPAPFYYIPIAGIATLFFLPLSNSSSLSVNAFPRKFFATIFPSLSKTKI